MSSRKLMLFVMLALIVISGVGMYAIRGIRLQNAAASPLIGTWKNEAGGVWNIRPDGTARFRLSSGKEIGFCEWTHDKNEFAYLQFSSSESRYSLRGRLTRAAHAVLRGEPTERSEVIEVSPGQFKLRFGYLHGETGEPVVNVVTFTRTQDEELETAP